MIKLRQPLNVETLFGRQDVTNTFFHLLAQALTANVNQVNALVEQEDGEVLEIPEAVADAGIPTQGGMIYPLLLCLVLVYYPPRMLLKSGRD